MSSFGEQYAAWQMTGHDPTEPENCGMCGSRDIRWDDPADGWCCADCHATDADET